MGPCRTFAACRRCSGARTRCRTMCTVGSRHRPCGMHLDATDLQSGAHGLAEFAERGHGRFPPPTAVAAGRRVEYGNSGRAGTVGRGSRRRVPPILWIPIAMARWITPFQAAVRYPITFFDQWRAASTRAAPRLFLSDDSLSRSRPPSISFSARSRGTKADAQSDPHLSRARYSRCHWHRRWRSSSRMLTRRVTSLVPARRRPPDRAPR